MEWVLILSINITEIGQVSQAPAVVPGFSSKERCEAAGKEIATRLMYQSSAIAKSKGYNRKQDVPHTWSDCICIEK